MNTAKGTPRMRPEARRQQLLGVAYACLADQGLAGLSLESVARSANVTSPLLRHYFGSREGLITAVVQAAIDEVMAILDAPPSAGGLEPRLRAYLQLIQRDPWAHGVWMHGGESHPAVRTMVDKARIRLAELSSATSWPTMDETQRLHAIGWVGFIESTIAEWISSGAADAEPPLQVCLAAARSLGVAGG